MEGMTASPRPNRPSFSIALEKPPLTISRLTASATSSCSSPTSSTDSSPTHFRRALSSKLGGRPPDLVAAALAENLVAAAGLRARSSPPLYFHQRSSSPSPSIVSSPRRLVAPKVQTGRRRRPWWGDQAASGLSRALTRDAAATHATDSPQQAHKNQMSPDDRLWHGLDDIMAPKHDAARNGSCKTDGDGMRDAC